MIEGYSKPETTICDPTEKPGVKLFRQWVIDNYGGIDLGIIRSCAAGQPATSHHHEGRAWDWGMSVYRPKDKATVERLLNRLFATDDDGNEHALIRRAGIRYIIWNRKIWSTGRRKWHPYMGKSPHATHVHFSFSKAGANGETSFYQDEAYRCPVDDDDSRFLAGFALLVIIAAVALKAQQDS